jgi:hypothetical protein
MTALQWINMEDTVQVCRPFKFYLPMQSVRFEGTKPIGEPCLLYSKGAIVEAQEYSYGFSITEK